MAVTSAKEAKNSGYGVISALDDYHYVRTWYVETDNVMGWQEVYAGAVALGMPALHDTYVFNPGGAATPELDRNLVVVQFNKVRHPENPRFWTVGVEYNTIPGFSLGDPGESSWTYHLPEVRFNFIAYTRPCEFDIDGKVIANSAGVPFNPKEQRDDHRLVCWISRNEMTYAPGTALAYMDSINTDVVFGGVGLHKAKITGFGGIRKTIENTLLWQVDYEIQFNRETWIRKVLDQGHMEKDPQYTPNQSAELEYRLIRGRDALPFGIPVNLDGQGRVQGPDDPPVKLEFHIYPERAFAPLNLPPLVVNLDPST